MNHTTIDWRRTSARTWEVTIDRRTAEEREWQARWLNYEAQAAMAAFYCGATLSGDGAGVAAWVVIAALAPCIITTS